MIFQAMLVTTILSLATEINPALASRAPCPTSCGNLTIPFPFGTSSDCYLDDSFLITCNNNFNPPKAFLNLGSVEVLDISLDGIMRVASPVASHCHHSSKFNSTISELTLARFPVSSRRNKFTAIGCDTDALVKGSVGWKQVSAGCVSWCDSVDSVVNGSCSGIGCCQTSIPKGLRDILVYIERNRTRVKSFSPCGYAFVVETVAFEFSSSDLKDTENRKTVPVILDWSVGILSCQEAWKNLSSFACRATHSECSDASNGIGYRCSCLRGFEGNPYIVDGCQDIDECIALKEPCEGTCTNLQGSYSCSCPKGFEGDGKKDGSGCHPKSQIAESPSFSGFGRDGSTSALFYIVSGVLVASVGGFWIFWRRKQKKVDSLRQNLSLRNGGQLLEEIIPTFSAADLEEATNNYDVNNILSDTHRFRTKYKGTLSDGRMVTIAKCDAVDGCNIQDFKDKITTLYKIDHRNMVRLLGCCLQTIVPLLVCQCFELKTLHDYIHDDRLACDLSWDIGLKIASEIAGVLEFMHSYRGTQIIHGGLNSSVILLDNDYTVKMHCFDFNLLSVLSEYVGHCPGYSAPEGGSSGITVESDVYSFGVILAEILTGQKAYSDDRPQDERYLAQYFVKGGDNLPAILAPRLGTDGRIDQLTEVAMLAKRCLSREERPTMKDVAIALENAIKRKSGSTTISPNPSQERTARTVVRKIGKFYRSVNLTRYFPIRVSTAKAS